MKQVLLGLAGACLMLPVWASRESVSRIHIGDTCNVMVTTFYDDGTMYMRDMDCSTWDYVLQQRRSREAAEAERKQNEEREAAQAAKMVEWDSAGLGADIRVLTQYDNQWYPDRRAKALTGLSAGKSVEEFYSLLEEMNEFAPGHNWNLTQMFKVLLNQGYGTGRVTSWSYHAFEVCGEKNHVSYVVNIQHGDRLVRRSMVWAYGFTFSDNEVNKISLAGKDCVNFFD